MRPLPVPVRLVVTALAVSAATGCVNVGDAVGRTAPSHSAGHGGTGAAAGAGPAADGAAGPGARRTRGDGKHGHGGKRKPGSRPRRPRPTRPAPAVPPRTPRSPARPPGPRRPRPRSSRPPGPPPRRPRPRRPPRRRPTPSPLRPNPPPRRTRIPAPSWCNGNRHPRRASRCDRTHPPRRPIGLPSGVGGAYGGRSFDPICPAPLQSAPCGAYSPLPWRTALRRSCANHGVDGRVPKRLRKVSHSHVRVQF
ncbi:exported protein of unknown function [Streptomyces murinus]